MVKIKVHKLSKEIGKDSKEIIKFANKQYGLKLTSHTSGIDENIASNLRKDILRKGSMVSKTEADDKEQVKVYKKEDGQEVVERRKGGRVTLRRKKKKVEDDHQEIDVKEPTLADGQTGVDGEINKDELKTNVNESAGDVLSEPDHIDGKSEESVSLDDPSIEDTEVESEAKETPEVKAEPVTGATDAKADVKKESPKKNKSQRAKISKKDIIDQETLDELRSAFRTKFPSIKKEYVVKDKKPKPKQFDHGRRNKRVGDRDSGADIQNNGNLQPLPINKTLSESTEKKPIKIGETIVVNELAKKMSVKGVDLIKKLLKLGTPSTINQVIDNDTATIVAGEFGYEVVIQKFEEQDFLIDDLEEGEEKLVSRPPVVTLMGHVDHGKTTLLDSIRQTKVVDFEAGGITQHIDAYKVVVNNRTIVFVDTPGHEAFTSMRSRGASITDIVILVVAADDGVMPQTVEAINHAKAAEVPLIVAINKIDKEEADTEKIKRQLSEIGMIAEEWGGDALFAEVSAKAKRGIDDLLELILLQADIMELKAVADKRANGVVIEAKLDKGRGPVSTMLVTEGTLKISDIVTCGVYSGKVRALRDENGKNLKSAGPSIPVEVMGISGVPSAGEKFHVVKDEKIAKEIIAHRETKSRQVTQTPSTKVSLESLFSNVEEGETKELVLIIKADTQGSVEALKESISKLSNEKCKVNFIHSAVGGINESDVVLASASNAVVVGFNVRPNTNALKIAESEGISLELHSIIYDVVNRIKNAMEGLLKPIVKEEINGHAEVKETFRISKIGTIAGCIVSDGVIRRDDNIRVLRDSVVIYDGKLKSLKRFKDDVKEVQSGYECGISIENFNDIKISDTLELYHLEEFKQEL